MPKLQKLEKTEPLVCDEYEASRLLNLSVVTLRRDRRDGRLGIPFCRLGRQIGYRIADLEAWLAAAVRVAAAVPRSTPLRRRGRPSNREQDQAASAGMSVAEFRAAEVSRG